MWDGGIDHDQVCPREIIHIVLAKNEPAGPLVNRIERPFEIRPNSQISHRDEGVLAKQPGDASHAATEGPKPHDQHALTGECRHTAMVRTIPVT